MAAAMIFDRLAAPLPPSRTAQWLLGLVVTMTAAMLMFAGLTRLPETAVAPGRVVSGRPLQIVSNPEGGSVAAILVRPGQHVAKNTLLMQLDPRAVAADYGKSTATANALQARIARLLAEGQGRSPEFSASLVRDAPEAVAAEQALWSAHLADVRGAAAADGARVDAASRSLAEAQADVAARTEAVAQASREIAVLQPLVDKGIEPAISLQRARSQLAQYSAAAAGAGAAVARARAMQAEAAGSLRSAGGRFRSQSADALASAQAELAGLTAGLPALAGRLARADVRSPIAGTVQRVLVATIGGTIRAGDPLVEIVPAGEALVVEARVRPADIAFVHAGQAARVKLTAYDASVYGGLDGRIIAISPDAVLDERGNEGHYMVRIATTKAGLVAPDGAPLAVVPGMVAQVDLIGRQRSILSYLLSPVTKLGQNAFRER